MNKPAVIASLGILAVLIAVFVFKDTTRITPSPYQTPDQSYTTPPETYSTPATYTSPYSTPTPPIVTGKCYVGGCSGQICSDQTGLASTCEWTEAYACYQTAKCERQSNGQCGWTETPALQMCLDNAK